MVWTYLAPGVRDIDTLRYLLGDTDSTEQLVQDEELAWELTQHSTTQQAAAAAARVIARKFARRADESYQGYSVRHRDRAEFYWQLARELSVSGAGVAPFVGGISVANKESYDSDTDRVKPAFRVGQWDYESPGNDEAVSNG